MTELKNKTEILTYRGHLRNWKTLCRLLNIHDTSDRDKRETEILIRAYEKWGHNMGLYLEGMFSAVIHDDVNDLIFCIRDPFGTKPFYYYETEDGEFLYGTTINEIMQKPGFKKELNEKLLQIYLTMTYIPGEETFFRGVKKLMPGRYLIRKDGVSTISRYWKPEFHPDNTKTLQEWADEIH